MDYWTRTQPSNGEETELKKAQSGSRRLLRGSCGTLTSFSCSPRWLFRSVSLRLLATVLAVWHSLVLWKQQEGLESTSPFQLWHTSV